MVANSAVAIANMALSNIGSKSTIESLAEKSAEGRQCNIWYNISRVQALEGHPWGFARKRLALALDSEAAPEVEWIYRYQYPVDCLKAREIENPLGPLADAVPYQIETNSLGVRTILTDSEDAKLIYTFNLQDTTAFSAFFDTTLSYLLAHYIAFPLTADRTIKLDMIKVYQSLIGSAKGQDANESVERKPREAEWIRGRA